MMSPGHSRRVLATLTGFKCLLVITCTELVEMVPLKQFTASELARGFATPLSFCYSPPKTLRTDNGKQMTAKFFTNVC